MTLINILRASCCTALYMCFFFFNDTATTEIYTLSLHDALPIWAGPPVARADRHRRLRRRPAVGAAGPRAPGRRRRGQRGRRAAGRCLPPPAALRAGATRPRTGRRARDCLRSASARTITDLGWRHPVVPWRAATAAP